MAANRARLRGLDRGSGDEDKHEQKEPQPKARALQGFVPCAGVTQVFVKALALSAVCRRSCAHPTCAMGPLLPLLPPQQDLALLLCQDRAAPALGGAGGPRVAPHEGELALLQLLAMAVLTSAHPAPCPLVGTEVAEESVPHTAPALAHAPRAEHPFPAQPSPSTQPSSPPRHRLPLCSPPALSWQIAC